MSGAFCFLGGAHSFRLVVRHAARHIEEGLVEGEGVGVAFGGCGNLYIGEGCLRSSAREIRGVVSSGFFFIIANPFASVGMSGGNDAECLAAHGEGDVQGKAVDLSRLVIASLAVVLASVFAHEG